MVFSSSDRFWSQASVARAGNAEISEFVSSPGFAMTLPILPDCLELSVQSVESIHISEAVRPLRTLQTVRIKGKAVRFVARLAIAIAILTSPTLLCLGQSFELGSSSRAASPMRSASQPSLTAPQSVEGAWVTDGETILSPNELPVDESVVSDEAGTWPDGFAGDCESCDEQNCLLGDDGGRGHGRGVYWNDLWDEVHAHRRTWFQLDYLYFWAKGNPLPPLVTTSPLGTPQTQAGILPESATTQILFGNGRVDTEALNGGRINFGYWLIDGEFLGIEGQYFTFQQANTEYHAASDFTNQPNSQILARPFINYDPNLPNPTEDAALVAFPNFVVGPSTFDLNGTIDVRTTSNIQSANATLRRLLWIDFTTQRRLDVIGGYRFFRLDDSVTIDDSTSVIGGPLASTVFASQDQFRAINQFHGGEIGLKGQCYHGPLSIELIGKIALGNMTEKVNINGFNTVTVQNVTVSNVGGLLTQTSNIGQYRRDVFAVLPEANANLRFDITKNLRATLGYTFVYTNRLQRSGDAIDRGLNPTQINGGTLVGDARPAFSFTDTTFWLHGANAGIEYRW